MYSGRFRLSGTNSDKDSTADALKIDFPFAKAMGYDFRQDFMKTKYFLLAALLFCTSISIHAREWTNTDGVKISAELLSVNGDSVVLKMENGREYTVPLNTLSAADNEFAKSWQAEQTALAEAPAPKTETLMTKPGKLLYSNNFSEIDGDWKMPFGDWAVTEGVLSGIERPADDHGGVMKRAQTLKDAIIEFDVMLGATKGTSFSIDDDVDHVARVSISSTGFQARKDDHDHEGPDVAKPFNQVSEELDTDEWHTVCIEIKGEEMLAQIDEEVSLGSDPLIATDKTKWGFTVAGDTVKFRDLKIWEALPNEEWEKTGDRLKRRLDIEE